MSKVRGSVKWFSNKKGYGFITPADGSPISEDIFVHQSSLLCDGYRTLYEGWEVEFEIGHDDDGKAKAVNVTGPGGKPCHGERSSRRRPERGSSKPTQRNRAKPKEAFWHAVLADDVKAALKEKNIRTGTGTIDVSCDDVRVKLGTNDYASVAHVGAVIAEGTFSCGEDGVAKFSWTHCIHCPDGGDWAVDLEKVGLLPEALSLADAKVTAVGAEETAQTLWGEKPDPKDVLEASGFLMRRVVLTPRRRS